MVFFGRIANGWRSREPLYWKGGSAPVPDPTVQIAARSQPINTTWVGRIDQMDAGLADGDRYDQSGRPIYNAHQRRPPRLLPISRSNTTCRNQIADQLRAVRIRTLGPSQYTLQWWKRL